MDANLLIVSSEDLPNPLFVRLEDSGFTCFYSRGVLKTKEILGKQQIDAIVWLFLGHESALGKDLAGVFNRHADIPIVFITQNYEQLDFAEEVRGLYANLDMNDDQGDIIRTVETACNQSIIEDQQPEETKSDTHEIEFRNIVSQVFGKTKESESNTEEDPKAKLPQVDLWEAVDKNEKQILAGKTGSVEKKSLIPKLKTLIKKNQDL